MSDLFVDNIKHQSSQGSGTITIGASGETIAAASGSTNNIGIAMADQYRIESNISMSTLATFVPVTTWVQSSGRGAGSMGSNMSHSSGVFTFPQTGHYLIMCQATFYQGGADYMALVLQTTNDNSTYNLASRSYQATNTGTNQYATASHSYIMDVTDTANDKCRFSYITQATAILNAGGSHNETAVYFCRLGDT